MAVVEVVPIAAAPAAVPASRPFRPLLHRVRLADPDPAARSARRWYTFPTLPRSARGFRRFRIVSHEVVPRFGNRAQTKEESVGYETRIAVLRTAHVVPPRGKGGSRLGVEFKKR